MLILYAVISLNWESTIYSVPEGEAVEVCIAVEGGELEKTVEFSIISHPGGAQEEDYGVVFLQLSLWPSETKVCFHIETINDDTVEGDETFQLILSSQDPAVTIATPALATINIEDNDGKLCTHTHTHTHNTHHTCSNLLPVFNSCRIWIRAQKLPSW